MVARLTHFAAASFAVAMTTTTALAGGPAPAPVAPPVTAPVAPAVYDWSGPYAGVTLSFNKGNFGNDGIFPGDGEGELDGGAAGIVLGYDFQNGNWVFGAELNVSGSRIDGVEECSNPAFDCGVEVERYGSLRGRLGYLAAPRTLLYGTAGFAAADVYGYTDGPAGENGETNRLNGAVYGIGFEQMISNRFSIRGAVLRHDFNESDFNTDILYQDVDVDFTTIEFGGVMRF